MDAKKMSAYVRLFSKKPISPPTQADVDLLIGAYHLDANGEQALSQKNPDAHGGYLDFIDDAIVFIAEVPNKDHKDLLLALRKGKPAPVPASAAPVTPSPPPPPPAAPKGAAKGAKKQAAKPKAPKPAASTAAAQPTGPTTPAAPVPPVPATAPIQEPDHILALKHLFDPTQAHLATEADVALLQSMEWAKIDVTALTQETQSAFQACCTAVAGNAPADYVDGIDEQSHPQADDATREQLRTLLCTLLQVDPAQTGLNWTPPFAKPTPVENLLPTLPYEREAKAKPYYHEARELIEEVFQKMRSADPAVADEGRAHLHLWRVRIDRHFQGDTGEELKCVGRLLMRCVEDLQKHADPNSAAYKHIYVTPLT